MPLPLEISCREVQALLDSASGFLLLDCREPIEHRIAALEQAHLMPMSQIPERIGELSESVDRRIVVMCHHGVRSLQTAAWLRQQGFSEVQSMRGGIDQWSQEVDSDIPRY